MNFKTWVTKDASKSLHYCLTNKPGQTGSNRAEVVLSNYCNGDCKQMIEQFQELIARNSDISKPVWQIVLSFNEEKKLDEERLNAIIQECARELAFASNQYVAIEHTDTNYQHVHILVNRIGFDGVTINDYNNILRVLSFCKLAEKKFDLKKQLSIEGQVNSKSHNRISNRRHLRVLIKVVAALRNSKNLQEFIGLMESLSIKVYHSRGICFVDEKKVKVKGSQIDLPLKTIDRYLKMDRLLKNLHLAQLCEKRGLTKEHIRALKSDHPRKGLKLH